MSFLRPYPEYQDLDPGEAARFCEGTEKQAVRAAIADLILPRLGPSKCVLEIGCGNGIDAERYPAEFYTGIDFSAPLIEAARKFHPKYDFNIADGRRLVTRSYEAVFTKSVLEHLATEDEAIDVLREMVRVSRGLVLVAWHTPPRDGPIVERRLVGHFGKMIHQNTWRRKPLEKAIGYKIRKAEYPPHELWIADKAK